MDDDDVCFVETNDQNEDDEWLLYREQTEHSQDWLNGPEEDDG